ncbi:hypothetical protein ACEPAF_8750 [Sanghuangporus sanghuang]
MSDPEVDVQPEKTFMNLEQFVYNCDAIMKGAVFNAHGELMHNDGTIFDGSQSTRSFAIDEDMEKDAAIVDSVDFALTGRIPTTGDNEACQASVSLTDYHLLNGDGLRTLRDYDSVIGMSKDLPVTK